jgi:hypothetical protein
MTVLPVRIFALMSNSLAFIAQTHGLADVIKKAANCGGLSFSKAARLAASAKAGSLIAAIVSFSA